MVSRYVEIARRLRRASARSGFTLIELLVVIAIIAILAAILFPVFAQARESARKTACLSNTKQLGLGIMQYVQDYDEMYPMNSWDGMPIGMTNTDWGAAGANQPTMHSWPVSVQPYVKNTAIFVCPSDPVKGKTGWNGYSSTPDCWGVPFPISYGHNQMIFGYGVGGSSGCGGAPEDWVLSMPPSSMAKIPSPASTYMIADYGRGFMETWWINNLRAANYTRVYNQSAPGGGATKDGTEPWASRFKQDSSKRHQGGQNIAFADGHAKWYRGEAIYSGEDWQDGRKAPHGLFIRDY